MDAIEHVPWLLSSAGDGLAAWRSFVRGLEAHVSGQRSMLSFIALAAAAMGLVWLNVLIARRLLGEPRKPDPPA